LFDNQPGYRTSPIDDKKIFFVAKWAKRKMSIIDDYDFSLKELRKTSEDTIGIFLSINGFSTTVIGKIYQIIQLYYIDGNDLMAVLDGRVDFWKLFHEKLEYIAKTGKIFLTINDIIQGIDNIFVREPQE
jgi:hypothetical protein